MSAIPDHPRAIRWLAIAAAFSSILTTLASDGRWVEPATEVAFPLHRESPISGSALELAGGGVRKKLVFKVYALGLYLEPGAARERLAAWAGKSASDLETDEAIRAAIVSLPAERLAVLAFVRGVGAGQIAEALDDAAARALAEGDPARAAFRALWRGDIAVGERVELAFAADGTVTVVRAGQMVGAVRSEGLARALLESWLGPDPVSSSIRDGATACLPQVISPP